MKQQQLNVELSRTIPSDLVLISRVELEELKKNGLVGVYWNLKDLEQRTGKKSEWIKDNIPCFKEVLDSEKGGFVYYPKSKGQTWAFQATKMAEFLEKNFNQIFS